MWSNIAASVMNIIVDDTSLVNVLNNSSYTEIRGQLNVNGYRVLSKNIEIKMQNLGFLR